ncbi:Na+/H+ antiporter subunit D [Phragmitibacter flavus]|uniref:Na+/H+ antiporter subunit D n=2 Tax=Phragmitibacter flavus TaxID=2576071 RepID=A0A5R8KBE5_9BACT|nr:Na+/H+ antiporter subunit D [Phragmitibacter flavus]
MNWLIILPILLPLLTAIVLIFCRGSLPLQRILSTVSAAAQFVISILLLQHVLKNGILAVNMSNWEAPFGITFVADVLSASMVAVTGFMGFAVALFGLAEIDRPREKFGFYPLYHVLLMGVCGAFLTGDLFNLFVWFEVMLMASFVLLALGGERAQLEGSVKYLVLNFLSSGIFLTALGILYAEVGTLNMADIAVKLSGNHSSPLAMTSAMLLLVSFGVKAGVFPVFAWLPASYHTPPVTVSAIFAGLLTKVGVYSLIRVFTLMFVGDTAFTSGLIIFISVMTMITGVLGAAAQFEVRKILSFHIISQIGYMTLGLGLMTASALSASVFYIIHHIIVKTNLFLISGAITHARGSAELKKIGGLYRTHPWLAFLFLIPAMSLGGIPPLSGFFAKFTLVSEAARLEEYLLIGVALIVGVLTLYSMTKIWAEAFWKPDPRGREYETSKPIPWLMLLPIAMMAGVTLFIGFNPEWLLGIARQAGEQLASPDAYIQAVLGSQPPVTPPAPAP